MRFIPGLFNTAMVQSILEDRKTNTRRVITPQPEKHNDVIKMPIAISEYSEKLKKLGKSGFSFISTSGPSSGYLLPKCPYGEPGDIIWVRETWQQWEYPQKPPFSYAYKANGFFKRCGAWERDTPNGFADIERVEKWIPAIHMPKEACRVFLKVKSVRVERLRDISDEDAVKEGVRSRLPDSGIAKQQFFDLWTIINGYENLMANPWVWVIEFERTELTEDQMKQFLTK